MANRNPAANLLLFTFGLLAMIELAKADVKDCYACGSTVNDLSCLNDPQQVISCDKEGEVCCTIVRQEYLEEPGKIVSFARGCQDKCPDMGFTENPDSTHMFYLTYCNEPLCNTGPGNTGLTNGGGGGGDNGNSIWVPGVEESAASSTSTGILLVFSTVFLVFFRRDA